MKNTSMKNLWAWAGETAAVMTEILFPRRCPVCDGILPFRQGKICPPCFQKLSFTNPPTCKKCGKEVIGDSTEYCFDCFRKRKSFEYGIALLNYDDSSRHSMARIKYGGRKEYMEFYGEAMAVRYEKRIERMRADALIPVPVHKDRLKARGFNQADPLARSIACSLKQPVPVLGNILVRNKKTMPQKDLSPEERLKNLSEAFEVKKENIPDGIKRVILVDDIYTTGSTAEACTRVLLEAGIEQVYLLNVCIGHGR